MSNLQLSLKTKWFEMTKAGIKTEDYREINPYWCSRFLKQNGNKMSQKWWELYLCNYLKSVLASKVLEYDKIHRITINEFTKNIMTLGYPKSGDTEKILNLKHKGIEIRAGKKEWGAEPNILYFVILHGSVVE